MGSTYKFGKRIGRGGMAEVFMAIQEGFGGFEKLVVVKRIFPEFCHDENFIHMFLEEARLAASIRHQNVVHINDIGKDDNGYFIVMEYLSGESLAYVFDLLASRDERIPPQIAARMASEIAAGLHHAHTATDAAGAPQPIVHRDVTPSNLIVCFNGVAKLVDFGVAKATLSDGATQAGALKGKMSYLAPEQLEDKPVDGRTDVFQLGICLHELLTGQRLFSGDSDHEKMLAIIEKPIPRPSSIAPEVPVELDRIVLWMLERDPKRRPQSADVLRRELEKFLRRQEHAEHDIGEWMKSALPERYQERLELERLCVAELRGQDPEEADTTVNADTDEKTALHAPKSKRRAPEPVKARVAKPMPAIPAVQLNLDGFETAMGSGTRTPTMATVLHRKSPTRSTSAQILSPNQGRLVAAVLGLCMLAVGTGLWYLGGDRATPSVARAAKATVPPLSSTTMPERTTQPVILAPHGPVLGPVEPPPPAPVVIKKVPKVEIQVVKTAEDDPPRVEKQARPKKTRRARRRRVSKRRPAISVESTRRPPKRTSRRRPKTDNIDPWGSR